MLKAKKKEDAENTLVGCFDKKSASHDAGLETSDEGVLSFNQLVKHMKGEFKKTRKELCDLNQSVVRVDDRLVQIEQKLGKVEKSVTELDVEVKDIKKYFKTVEGKTRKLEHSFNFFEGDLACLGEGFDELQAVVENSENLAKKNNLQLRGLKEQAEGNDMHIFKRCYKLVRL